LLVGVENNNNIEENGLSDEEDSVPDVFYEEESDSDAELEEEETFIRGVEGDQSIGSKDSTPDGNPIPDPLCRSGRAPVQRTTLKPTFQGQTHEVNHLVTQVNPTNTSLECDSNEPQF